MSHRVCFSFWFVFFIFSFVIFTLVIHVSVQSISSLVLFQVQQFSPDDVVCEMETDIPALVKAGAVLPLKTMASVSDIAPDPLVLQVLGCGSASECNGTGTVYEDDGWSLGYTTGAYRLARVTHSSSAAATTVTIVPRAGGSGYRNEPATRAYQVELLTGATAPIAPKAVSVGGKPLRQIASSDGRAGAKGWWHGNATGLFGGALLVVGTGELSAADAVSVRVER